MAADIALNTIVSEMMQVLVEQAIELDERLGVAKFDIGNVLTHYTLDELDLDRDNQNLLLAMDGVYREGELGMEEGVALFAFSWSGE